MATRRGSKAAVPSAAVDAPRAQLSQEVDANLNADHGHQASHGRVRFTQEVRFSQKPDQIIDETEGTDEKQGGTRRGSKRALSVSLTDDSAAAASAPIPASTAVVSLSTPSDDKVTAGTAIAASARATSSGARRGDGPSAPTEEDELRAIDEEADKLLATSRLARATSPARSRRSRRSSFDAGSTGSGPVADLPGAPVREWHSDHHSDRHSDRHSDADAHSMMGWGGAAAEGSGRKRRRAYSLTDRDGSSRSVTPVSARSGHSVGAVGAGAGAGAGASSSHAAGQARGAGATEPAASHHRTRRSQSESRWTVGTGYSFRSATGSQSSGLTGLGSSLGRPGHGGSLGHSARGSGASLRGGPAFNIHEQFAYESELDLDDIPLLDRDDDGSDADGDDEDEEEDEHYEGQGAAGAGGHARGGLFGHSFGHTRSPSARSVGLVPPARFHAGSSSGATWGGAGMAISGSGLGAGAAGASTFAPLLYEQPARQVSPYSMMSGGAMFAGARMSLSVDESQGDSLGFRAPGAGPALVGGAAHGPSAVGFDAGIWHMPTFASSAHDPADVLRGTGAPLPMAGGHGPGINATVTAVSASAGAGGPLSSLDTRAPFEGLDGSAFSGRALAHQGRGSGALNTGATAPRGSARLHDRSGTLAGSATARPSRSRRRSRSVGARSLVSLASAASVALSAELSGREDEVEDEYEAGPEHDRPMSASPPTAIHDGGPSEVPSSRARDGGAGQPTSSNSAPGLADARSGAATSADEPRPSTAASDSRRATVAAGYVRYMQALSGLLLADPVLFVLRLQATYTRLGQHAEEIVARMEATGMAAAVQSAGAAAHVPASSPAATTSDAGAGAADAAGHVKRSSHLATQGASSRSTAGQASKLFSHTADPRFASQLKPRGLPLTVPLFVRLVRQYGIGMPGGLADALSVRYPDKLKKAHGLPSLLFPARPP